MAGTARLSIEVVPDLSGLTAMADSFREMAAAVEKMAESFRVVAEHVERVARDRTPTRDAARWRPDADGLPVRWCGFMHRETDHPGHEWDWIPENLSAPRVRSQCPGWPLPSITGQAPDCETGDDRTCTEACPLHG